MATDGHPVLLVPGFSGQDLVYWNVFRRRLESDGFPAFTMSFPGLGLQDIRESSRMLARRVDEVLDATGADKLSMIGHSLGGLVIRDFLQEPEHRERVGACATLGTPHQGTLTSLLAIVRPACRQMLPGSAYLKDLNAHSPGVPFVNVYCKRDPLVVPHSNAKLPGVDNHRLRLGGHWGLLIRRAAYRPILNVLSNA